jgi:2-dehydropantoate 2-reductase
MLYEATSHMCGDGQTPCVQSIRPKDKKEPFIFYYDLLRLLSLFFNLVSPSSKLARYPQRPIITKHRLPHQTLALTIMAAEKKKIAIIGAGPVGCAFAVHLVKAGHDVTIVGRGQRLTNLEENGGVLAKKSEKATEITKTPVKAVRSLDTTQPWDLVLLTITEHQFDEPLFATLKSCPKTTEILFMFNTFASLGNYFDVLGKERCIMGFPSITAAFHDGTLVHQFLSFGQITIISSPEWRSIFSSAEITCVHEPDMQSWLRTHAAVVLGVMSAVVAAAKRKSGVTWTEAQLSAGAAREGFALVKKLGNNITPKLIYYLGVAAPNFVLTGALWALTRVPSIRSNPQVPNWEREMLGLAESIIGAAPSDDDVRLVSQLRSKYV